MIVCETVLSPLEGVLCIYWDLLPLSLTAQGKGVFLAGGGPLFFCRYPQDE